MKNYAIRMVVGETRTGIAMRYLFESFVVFFLGQFVGYFALINLVLGIFNLLPVKGLDGGTAFLSLLCKFADINKAEFWVKILSFTIAITVLITALILTIRGKSNITLFIIGAYLIIMSVMKM
jgi:Zn-dependent protease